ncbi:MAG: hypothetical protein EP338_01145 [Bacteroidetes bacterium]|nr:MAG: hypothetical protein EP338_01145 [Bacteroidota bacterium]
MKKAWIYLVMTLLSMTSCVEIIDDLKINSDGSGTFKYVVNLSWSKVKVNSVLALDSLDGKRVPSLDEIRTIITKYEEKLTTKEGISNVKVDVNYDDFILKFQCDFENVTSLQKAIREIAMEQKFSGNVEELKHTWLVWDGQKLVRSVPTLTRQTTQLLEKEDLSELKNGKYSAITRFDRSIDHAENPLTAISPSKQACRVMTNPYALINELGILENTIYLVKGGEE